MKSGAMRIFWWISILLSVATIILAVLSIAKGWSAGGCIITLVWALVFQAIYQDRKRKQAGR